MNLEQFNAAPEEELAGDLMRCCAAKFWQQSMLKARPFESVEHCLQYSEKIWQQANLNDALEAFDAHPKIGDVSSLKAKYQNTAKLAGHEQSGMASADETLFEQMKALNDAYEDKFGFIFIVFATGKTAEQMLSILQHRINNDTETEWQVAAIEQGKITQLRLQQLLEG